MGTYTEIFFRAYVTKKSYDLMNDIHDRGRDAIPQEHSHPFFSTRNAAGLFYADGSSVFPYANHYSSHAEPLVYGSGAQYSTIYSVSFRANLKNYDEEIEKFFDYISGSVADEGFMGYSLHEDDVDPCPVLYYSFNEELHVQRSSPLGTYYR
nr:hypothetical protein [uncultured bacterium]